MMRAPHNMYMKQHQLKTCIWLVLASAAVLFFQPAAISEVYIDGGGKTGGSAASNDIFTALGGNKLWTEPVIINGVRTGITISLLEERLGACVTRIKELFPDALLSSNSDSMLAELKSKEGQKKRIYLVQLGGVFPVEQFSMEIPGEIPDNPDWISGLPLAADAIPVMTMQLPARDASYGFFTTSFAPEDSLMMAAAILTSNGWTSFPRGGDNSRTGAVFFKSSPIRLMTLSFSSLKGKTYGTVFLHSARSAGNSGPQLGPD